MNLKPICDRLNTAAPNFDDLSIGAYAFLVAARSFRDIYPGVRFDDLNLDNMHSQLMDHWKPMVEELEPLETEPIPRVKMEDLTKECFSSVIQSLVPVVIEGAAADTPAVRDWSAEFFQNHYRDYQCALADNGKQRLGTLGEVAEQMVRGQEGSGLYIHNIANIFNENPQLEAQLELPRILEELGLSEIGKHAGTQLFFGPPGTGSGWHAAAALNVFYNVHGRKRWCFVSPRHSPCMDTVIHPSGAYVWSPIDIRKKRSELVDSHPMFVRTPMYESVLEPGDILLNPPWWWHMVLNETPATIACAVRVEMVQYQYPLFTLVQRFFPHYQQLLRKGGRITDEGVRNQFNEGLSED